MLDPYGAYGEYGAVGVPAGRIAAASSDMAAGKKGIEAGFRLLATRPAMTKGGMRQPRKWQALCQGTQNTCHHYITNNPITRLCTFSKH